MPLFYYNLIHMSNIFKQYDKYLQFFRFILKYWNAGIMVDGSEESDNSGPEENWTHSPEELVEDLKNMGPTYIKLGQLLSTRPDMLPEPYLNALAELQDEVDGISYEEVEEIFREEIGVRISKAFQSFEKEPLASASIGQVHMAILHSGEKVAVKIQKPGIYKKVTEELDILLNLAQKAEKYSKESRKFSLYDTIEEIQYIFLQELNYLKEAQNLKILKENIKEFKHLKVPGVISDFCSQKVLTMEFIEGWKVTSLSPFQLQSLDKELLIDEFVKAYLKQIIVDGFAHADPHPGNIHVTKDGKLALMDLGMVARFSEASKDGILKLMIGLGNNDAQQVIKTLLKISDYDRDEANLDAFKREVRRKIQENQHSTASDLRTGQSILEMNKVAALNGVKLPIEFVSLGKILLNMDQIIAFLSPEHDLQKTIRDYVKHLMKDHFVDEVKAGNFFQHMLESKELVENLPYRLNKMSEDLADGKFRIEMKLSDENRFIQALQKVANRITVGLVVTALILGAALLMRIPTTWTLWGYPAFAILLFVLAAITGFYLVYEIMFRDENR